MEKSFPSVRFVKEGASFEKDLQVDSEGVFKPQRQLCLQ